MAALLHSGQGGRDPGEAADAGEGVGRAQCLETWGLGMSGVRAEAEAEGACLAAGGGGIEEVLCLPRIEVQMPVQHPISLTIPFMRRTCWGLKAAPFQLLGTRQRTCPP